MKNTKAPVTEDEVDTVGETQDAGSYVLRLYITGSSPATERILAGLELQKLSDTASKSWSP